MGASSASHSLSPGLYLSSFSPSQLTLQFSSNSHRFVAGRKAVLYMWGLEWVYVYINERPNWSTCKSDLSSYFFYHKPQLKHNWTTAVCFKMQLLLLSSFPFVLTIVMLITVVFYAGLFSVLLSFSTWCHQFE